MSTIEGLRPGGLEDQASQLPEAVSRNMVTEGENIGAITKGEQAENFANFEDKVRDWIDTLPENERADQLEILQGVIDNLLRRKIEAEAVVEDAKKLYEFLSVVANNPLDQPTKGVDLQSPSVEEYILNQGETPTGPYKDGLANQSASWDASMLRTYLESGPERRQINYDKLKVMAKIFDTLKGAREHNLDRRDFSGIDELASKVAEIRIQEKAQQESSKIPDSL